MEPIFTPVADSETPVVAQTFNILPDPNLKNFIPPCYGTPFSAALDVFAQEDLIITEKTQMIDLGFKAEFPADFACVLMPRSGYGAKFGLALANTLGLIDPDYRGTWMAAAWLHGGGTKTETIESGAFDDFKGRCKFELEIPRGEALGQLLFVRTGRLLPTIVSELSETVRGEGGFGSTNKANK